MQVTLIIMPYMMKRQGKLTGDTIHTTRAYQILNPAPMACYKFRSSLRCESKVEGLAVGGCAVVAV